MESTAEPDGSGSSGGALQSDGRTQAVSTLEVPTSPPLQRGALRNLQWNRMPLIRRGRRRRVGLGLGVLLVAVVVVSWLVLTQVSTLGGAPRASGFTEANEVLLSAQNPALIREVLVDVGTRVSTGMVVARLDDAAVQLQLRLADPAARQSLDIEADKYLIRSPLDGVVTRVPAHAGEQALPGRVIVVVTNPAQLNVKLSLPLRDLTAVRVGQPVAINVDALPDRTFAGTVASINDKAEFTPRNVQTETDRLNLVYGITVHVNNLDGLLKPGMPVQATFPQGP